jgi:hypothetical protein
MTGDRFFQALLDAKPGCTITDKVCKTGALKRPAVMTVRFSDGTSVSFVRAEAVRLKTEEQLAAFVAKIAA